jgi:hypothetical protein
MLFRATLIGFAGFLALGKILATELPVPDIGDVTRVDRNNPPGRQDAVTATYILKTNSHPTLGDAYIVVTDQTDSASLNSLERLANFHHGSIIHVQDLDALRTAETERDQLTSDLRQAQPRFVAIAPKPESFTENMVLGMWYVLTKLSDDQQLPVFPGILAAPNQTAFQTLIDRSIDYRPQTTAQVRPFVMGQVLGPEPFGQRSLQKVRMMRNLFAGYGCSTRSLILLAYSAVERGVAVAPATDQWQAAMNGPNQNIPAIPPDARPALDDASLLLMFGHGNPGTMCSLDTSAFRDVRMTGKTVMCGDCFSAASSSVSASDESFALRAVDNGADVVYAHMRENAGFPHLFPVLEAWMDGLTVGEAYQRLINALLAFNGLSGDTLISGDMEETNSLLYVIIGDPALQPLAKMIPVNQQASAPSN